MKNLGKITLALAKEIVGGPGGKWRFDKDHRFLFIDKIVGGSIPREFIAPIEAGIREALDNGILAGFPMVDVAAVLIELMGCSCGEPPQGRSPPCSRVRAMRLSSHDRNSGEGATPARSARR